MTATGGAPTASAQEHEPRVAVIVPCFNDGRLVPEALGSLAAQEPTELVVVDDCSTDPETIAVLAGLRERGIRVERHAANRGLSASRMTGVAATRAPFVYPLDADDLIAPGALSLLADLLQAHPEVALAFADYEEFGTRSRIVAVPAGLDPYRIAFRNEYPVSSLFRRDALVRAGGWNDVAGMVGYEDWKLLMTLAQRGERGMHAGPGQVALRRRMHGTRMLGEAGRAHRELYGHLRRLHPELFASLPEHRRRSDLDPLRKALYPLLYGSRPPLGLGDRVLALRRRLRA
jgi:glycosyltransferase involved in cell wall biosynthesis